MNETRVVALTGGASGIGQAFALRLAQDGASVAVLDSADTSEVMSQLAEIGCPCISVPCDVTDPDAVEAAARTVGEELGPASVLVNNVGIYPHMPFDQITYDEWRRVMAVNLDSMFLTSAAFVPAMRAAGWGRVVNVTSASVALTDPGFVAYVTSKMGVIGLTRALANDLGEDGITVNAIAPGLIRTRTAEDMWQHTPLFEIAPQYQVIKRPGEPGDLVGALSFLVSDDAAFITGQTLVVDGGRVRMS